MAVRNQTRRQVRGFVIVWTFISLLMGLATFVAIFFAYDNRNRLPEIALVANNQNNSEPIIVINSQTPLPTLAPTNTVFVPSATATTEVIVATQEQAIAQVATVQATNTLAPTNTPQPTFVPPDQDKTFQVGVQIQTPPDLNPDLLNGYYRAARQDMGVEWIKLQTRWEFIEPERGQFVWDELDLALAGARFFGIHPMLSIVTAPDWARESGVNLEKHGPPANNADYVNFVRAIFERYPGQVYAIEVWNEQNLDREWTSTRGLSATNYLAMLRDTYNMVQEVSPGTIVISGALSPTGVNNDIAIDDFRYMDMLISGGLLDITDCVGAHHNGYNIGPLVRWDAVPNDPTATFRGPFDNPNHSWSFRSTLEGYTQRIRNAGRDTKLCVTEFGWAVTEDLAGTPLYFEFADDNTLAEQSQFFVEALDSMSQGDAIWLAFIWNLNYGPQAGWDPANDNVPYSLIGPDHVFRPAFDAIRDWNAAYQLRIGNN